MPPLLSRWIVLASTTMQAMLMRSKTRNDLKVDIVSQSADSAAVSAAVFRSRMCKATNDPEKKIEGLQRTRVCRDTEDNSH